MSLEFAIGLGGCIGGIIGLVWYTIPTKIERRMGKKWPQW